VDHLSNLMRVHVRLPVVVTGVLCNRAQAFSINPSFIASLFTCSVQHQLILRHRIVDWQVLMSTGGSCRRCSLLNRPPNILHDTGTTFAPERVHSGSLSWLYICLHDTTTKCHAGASHHGVNSPRLLYRGENLTPVRNLATVSCKRETTTRFGVKSVCL